MPAVAGTRILAPNGLKIGGSKTKIAATRAGGVCPRSGPKGDWGATPCPQAAAASRERATGLITWGQDHLGDCRSGVIQTTRPHTPAQNGRGSRLSSRGRGPQELYLNLKSVSPICRAWASRSSAPKGRRVPLDLTPWSGLKRKCAMLGSRSVLSHVTLATCRQGATTELSDPLLAKQEVG